MLDAVDHQILAILQEDARISNSEIARRVGMANSAVHERVRKMEERGVIEGYQTLINPEAAGYDLLAYVFVKTNEGCWSDGTAKALSEIEQVQEVHSITGEDCYLVKVRARDTAHLNELLRSGFNALDLIISTRTTIVLETVKDSPSIPLDSPGEPD